MKTVKEKSVSSGKGGVKRRKFTAEYKADAVALVLDEQRSITDVASSLGIAGQTLGNWVRQRRTDLGERAGLTTDEKRELAELKRENRELKMERELLKRAAVFFATESAQ